MHGFEIKRTVKNDVDFENKNKYKLSVLLDIVQIHVNRVIRINRPPSRANQIAIEGKYLEQFQYK